MTKKISIIVMALAIIFGLGACDHHSKDNNKPESHIHTEEVIPGYDATCTEAGLTEGKKCSECGEILVAQNEIQARGHNYIEGICLNCEESDPAYKKEINYREVYNIHNNINILTLASSEEIKNIVGKWNDKLSGKLEGSVWEDEGEMPFILQYDFSNADLTKSVYEVDATCEGENLHLEMINCVIKRYFDGVEGEPIYLKNYHNLTNIEFKNKVNLESYAIYDVALGEIMIVIQEYGNVSVSNHFDFMEGIREVTSIGFDENNHLVMDLVFGTHDYDFEARFVSDKEGNLLYFETLSFDAIADFGGIIEDASWFVLTY